MASGRVGKSTEEAEFETQREQSYGQLSHLEPVQWGDLESSARIGCIFRDPESVVEPEYPTSTLSVVPRHIAAM